MNILGVSQLAAGYTQIVDGVSSGKRKQNAAFSSGELKNGAGELYDGIVAYCDGVSELAAGPMSSTRKPTVWIHSYKSKLTQILASIGGEESKRFSFVR